MGVLSDIKNNIGWVLVGTLIIATMTGSVGYVVTDVRGNTKAVIENAKAIRDNSRAIDSLGAVVLSRNALDSLGISLRTEIRDSRASIICAINAERQGLLCED